jgi:SAM-dependent methyltransferase
MIRKRQGDLMARDTYDVYAAAYDDFNRDYRYEHWTERLLSKAEEQGLDGDRLLDLGCGTGLSFIPMLERGWQVTACDISSEMLKIAEAKVNGRARLLVADMRALPALGQFDLVWAVNDAINYLLRTDELESAMAGIRRNLAPEGFALFDVNTLATYRTFFCSEHVVEEQGKHLVWQGQMSPDEVSPGSISEARFEVRGEVGTAHIHRQRHFTEREVVASIERGGLRCVGIFGEIEGALRKEVDEEVHSKAVYIAAHQHRPL